jgi:hypothetical protein
MSDVKVPPPLASFGCRQPPQRDSTASPGMRWHGLINVSRGLLSGDLLARRGPGRVLVKREGIDAAIDSGPSDGASYHLVGCIFGRVRNAYRNAPAPNRLRYYDCRFGFSNFTLLVLLVPIGVAIICVPPVATISSWRYFAPDLIAWPIIMGCIGQLGRD